MGSDTGYRINWAGLSVLAVVIGTLTGAAGIAAIASVGTPIWQSILLLSIATVSVAMVLILVIRGSVLAVLKKWTSRRLAVAAGIALAAAVAAMLAVLFIQAPVIYPPPPPAVTPSDFALRPALEAARISAIASLRTATLAGGLAGFAALGGLVVNALNLGIAQRNLELGRATQEAAQATGQRTFDLSARGQLTDRYTSAVTLLSGGDESGDPSEMGVLGGIYALQSLARDAPEDYRETVAAVLAALIRTTAGLAPHQIAGAVHHGGVAEREQYLVDDELPPHPDDDDIEYGAALRAAIQVLSRLAVPPPEVLHEVDAIMAGTTRRALLDQVKVGAMNPDLRRTNLRRMDFDELDLRGAFFVGSHLSSSTFRFADLRFANFSGADLTGVQFSEAKLGGARFSNAWLSDANFDGAHLGPGILFEERSAFGGAHVDRASFLGADLRGVIMRNVRGLAVGQLSDTRGDRRTMLPNGFTRPVDWSDEETG